MTGLETEIMRAYYGLYDDVARRNTRNVPSSEFILFCDLETLANLKLGRNGLSPVQFNRLMDDENVESTTFMDSQIRPSMYGRGFMWVHQPPPQKKF